MKFRASFIFFLALTLLFSLSSCEGDEGPVGPAGPTGPTGNQGAPGEQGWGTQDCAKCHSNSQLITAKLYQWEHSVHATGGNTDRNGTTCAICHTSQGFLEILETGAITTAAEIADPLPPNCYACHKIHQTYTEDDWALTQTDPVTFRVGGQTVDLGKGNLCVSCHQIRAYSPALPDPATGGGTVTITSNRYGPHYGPQGVMLTGFGGYEVAGPEPYQNSAHTTLLANANKNGCVTCHMGTAQGVESGGHTFRVISEEGTINTDACVECHAVAAELNTLVGATQGEIDALMEELRLLLVDRGLLNGTTDLAIVPQDFEGHEAGALFNYKFVQDDFSRGVHNYKYAKALLKNSIAAMQ